MRKFFLSSMYYAAHSLLTLFSALVFPTVSLSLFSPCLFGCALVFFLLLQFTPLLHCASELLQRCLRFRHTLGTYLSPSTQGRRSKTTKPYFFPWVSCSSVLSSCTLGIDHIWITPQIFSLLTECIGRLEDVMDSCTGWNYLKLW